MCGTVGHRRHWPKRAPTAWNPMRALHALLFATLLAAMPGCRCYAFCTGSAVVQLTEIPDGDYEVTLELPSETLTWTCDGAAASDEEGLGADCESGYFSVSYEDELESAAITLNGVTTEYPAECELRKICGQKCWDCVLYVE